MYRIGWKQSYAFDICSDVFGVSYYNINQHEYTIKFKKWLKHEYRAKIDNTLGGSFIAFETKEDMTLFLMRWS